MSRKQGTVPVNQIKEIWAEEIGYVKAHHKDKNYVRDFEEWRWRGDPFIGFIRRKHTANTTYTLTILADNFETIWAETSTKFLPLLKRGIALLNESCVMFEGTKPMLVGDNEETASKRFVIGFHITRNEEGGMGGQVVCSLMTDGTWGGQCSP
jgi:hypothetical protein